MSSLENLPKPDEQINPKRQRKRKAPVVSSSVNKIAAIKSIEQEHSLPPPSTEASSVSIAIQFPTMNESSIDVDTYNDDIIDRILLNAESRHGPQCASIFESSSSTCGASASHTTRRDFQGICKDAMGGNLTAEELNQLSVLSTVDVSVREHVGGYVDHALAKKDNGRRDFNWSCIDVDSVTRLISLLEDHVKSALSIDLIREAREAHDREDEEVRVMCSV